jgi:SAM-dependent methyltransferase
MLKFDQLSEPESYFPLKVFFCSNCFLVQTGEIKRAKEIFDDEYTYFSSYSKTWLAHAKQYVDMMMNRFRFTSNSQVIEVASNDGYLLQYFKDYNIPVLGVDPTANTASAAKEKGIHTIIDFFGAEFAEDRLANKDIKGDLIIGNNVFAHVPDINDFAKGLRIALKDKGIITMEFPHLVRLIENNQFDTIYHEHFSYLSLTTVIQILTSQGLELFDVEEIPTHGGSLRIFVKHIDDDTKSISPNVKRLTDKELNAGINSNAYYKGFQESVGRIKDSFLRFLLDAKENGSKVIGYGAAAKGNTLINFSGIKGNDLIQFVVDASPHKQNKFLPGSHIPVYALDRIETYKPDYIIIFPWNLKNEISNQLSFCRNWGAQFVTFIPEKSVF